MAPRCPPLCKNTTHGDAFPELEKKIASSGKRVGNFGPFLNCCLLLLLSLWACGNALALSIMSTAMTLFQAVYL
jgi:hypothetical protein